MAVTVKKFNGFNIHTYASPEDSGVAKDGEIRPPFGYPVIEKSCDKLSIRNHSVPPFVIRVLCLNTLYAKGYFFYQPDNLESTNLKEKTGCFYQPDNLESTNPNPII